MEVDIYPLTQVGPILRGRRKKEKVSAPKQRNLNDKNAKRYFIQIVNSNFSAEDLHVTVTYAQVPESIEEAEREAANYIRRLAHRRKREGLPPIKYVLVTESKTKEGKPVRVHHHIIMSGGLDRDTVEDLWRRPRKRGQKQGDRIGYANTDRLKPNEYGLEALARYLSKEPAGKKRWSSSQNLDKPECRTNDSKYTRRQLERIVRDEIDNQAFWDKKYPEWDMTECKPVFNEITGWAVYLKLRRRTQEKGGSGNVRNRKNERRIE
ncbi:hypothetical protein [Cohnella sp.]|uniref:rolling circle replication-associated protein n=1 Tax=Cohnella sp. TaxID=1883426 RepID=UPI003704848C